MWLLGNLRVQTAALAVPAVLMSPHGFTNTQAGGRLEWLPVLLLAMQSGSQVALVHHDCLACGEEKER